ncbi:MAG TPA: hypothetical protein VEK57_03050 [Thermoanaerobaculia bacterium]|nr:hypothetical protein [Thermoanaerobaculia bacterium]
MSKPWRRSLLVFSFVIVAVFASAAYGQECNTCDPWYSYCGDYCDVCIQYGMDGCVQWQGSTCGAQSGACLDDYCTPNWVEQSRVTQGTYDGRSLWGCNHHLVQWVVTIDTNECNIASYFHTRSYCDDVIDDYKNGCCYPSCCEGYGELNTLLQCDGEHSCTG